MSIIYFNNVLQQCLSPQGNCFFYKAIKNVFILTLVPETTYRKYDGPCEKRTTILYKSSYTPCKYFNYQCLIIVYVVCNKSSHWSGVRPLITLNNCCGGCASRSSAALMASVISCHPSSVVGCD